LVLRNTRTVCDYSLIDILHVKAIVQYTALTPLHLAAFSPEPAESESVKKNRLEIVKTIAMHIELGDRVVRKP
jgi:hypothetical protein